MPTSRTKTSDALARALPAVLGVALVAGCSTGGGGRYSQRHDSAPARLVDVAGIPDAVPRVEPRSRYGNPDSYVVRGRRYHTLDSSRGYVERGIASWYGTKFHGHRTSSGEPYDMYRMTAAHKTLPLPTYARVTNLRNGRSVSVKINDRGPFHENRLIDLSWAAAARLDILGEGTGLVEVRAIDPARPPQQPVTRQASTGDTGRSWQPSRPKTAAAPAAGKPALYLQVGAFSSRLNAERLRARLAAADIDGLRIHEGSNGKGRIYRLRIGPLDTVEAADRLSRTLHAQGIASPHVVVD